jgi:hypothetical protein
MAIPKPVIFLRNQFTIKSGQTNAFLHGKENLIRRTYEQWDLIASAAEREIFAETITAEPNLPAVNIWRLKDWESLYNKIYTFSDTGWYLSLGASLGSEQQEFLVGALGAGTIGGSAEKIVSPKWVDNHEAGYCYLFEQVLPVHGEIRSYLRDVNWFTGQMVDYGWERVWSGIQVTAAPSEISLLWKVPRSVENIEQDLRSLQDRGKNAARYRNMMKKLRILSRRKLYPTFAERIAQLTVANVANEVAKNPPRPQRANAGAPPSPSDPSIARKTTSEIIDGLPFIVPLAPDTWQRNNAGNFYPQRT